MKSPAITTTLEGKNKTLYLQVIYLLYKNVAWCLVSCVYSKLRLNSDYCLILVCQIHRGTNQAKPLQDFER